jgi:hypothetical protein
MWVTTILADLDILHMDVTFADIKKTSKPKWKSMVKQSIKEKSLKQLEIKKQTHSKVKS